jgi:hypothetical protein
MYRKTYLVIENGEWGINQSATIHNTRIGKPIRTTDRPSPVATEYLGNKWWPVKPGQYSNVPTIFNMFFE